MYTTFFGFRELPFPLANDPHFFYPTPTTQKTEESLIAAFHKHTGLVLLTGEPGTGKTILLRRIISSLESHTSVILLPFSAVTFDDILSYLCEHFAIVTSSNDSFTRMLTIQEHLQTSTGHGMRIVLCIDEAQNLRKETLDRLRLLLHLRGPNGQLFHILLAGQRLLETKLAHPDLRHIQQYITVHCRLEPLARDEVSSFILHRLRTAGCDRTDLFTPEVIERIAYYSQCVPRLVNVICDNALITTYLAGSKIVSHDVIEDVAQNLQLNNDADSTFNETVGPPVAARSFPKTQERPQPSSRQWLHNLVWTGAGLAFAWLSSDPQLSTFVPFSLFSMEKAAQIVSTPASLVLAPMSSAILPHENQPQMSSTRTESSPPMVESPASPPDWTPAPQIAKRDGVLLWQQKQSLIAAEHSQNRDYAAVSPRVPLSPEKQPSQHSPNASSLVGSPHVSGKGTLKQSALPIRKRSGSEVSGAVVLTSVPFTPRLIESRQRQQQSLHPSPGPTLLPQRRTYEAKVVLIHPRTSPIREALFRAVVTNNIQETNRLLAARAPVNAKSKSGWTALMIAARDNRPDLVRLLLTRGAEVNVTNKEGETALIHAADNDHPAIVRLLLNHGAAIDTKSSLGWTALMYAASKGHRLTVETLLSKGANPKVKDKDGQTASMYAARQGNISVLKEHLRDRSALRNRFGRLDVERLQLVKRRDYSVIASLLKEAETKR